MQHDGGPGEVSYVTYWSQYIYFSLAVTCRHEGWCRVQWAASVSSAWCCDGRRGRRATHPSLPMPPAKTPAHPAPASRQAQAMLSLHEGRSQAGWHLPLQAPTPFPSLWPLPPSPCRPRSGVRLGLESVGLLWLPREMCGEAASSSPLQVHTRELVHSLDPAAWVRGSQAAAE